MPERSLKPMSTLLAIALAVALAGPCAAAASASGESVQSGLIERPAVESTGALKSSMLAVALAGKRLVAVGDRGVVLLSDDDGATFRQAKQVPTRVMLTSVYFLEGGQTGWAAGHWGVILKTIDAGETWSLQRDDTTVDQPLFTIFFTSEKDGYAAGLWSLFLRTNDGGRSWTSMRISPAEPNGKFGKSERNLLGSFKSEKGTRFITAEQGAVYRSENQGGTWKLVQTAGAGSFWTGVGLRSGTLLVAGLGGIIYRSTDDGLTWSAVASKVKSSVTGLAELPGGKVVGVGMDGLTLASDDDGLTFKENYDAERTTLTAVIGGALGKPVEFSVQGPRKRP